MQIVKVGITVQQGDEVVLRLEGDLPPDCVVVFFSKISNKELKALTKHTKWDDTAPNGCDSTGKVFCGGDY